MTTALKIIIFAVCCLIWGSTWSAIKIGLATAPPLTTAGVRFLLAAAVLFLILRVRRIPFPMTREFIGLGIFLGVFQMATAYALVYWAEQHIDSALAAILFSTMPLVVAILARIMLGDSITLPKAAGIVLGFGGVLFIFSDHLALGADSNLGIAAILGSVFLASLSTIVIKKHSTRYHPFASLFLPILIGGIVLCSLALLFERDRTILWNGTTIGTIVYLALAGTIVAFGLYFWLIKHVDVTVMSYITFIIPVVAGVLGWIFLGETLTMKVVVGGAMILAGIALATRVRKRPIPPSTKENEPVARSH